MSSIRDEKRALKDRDAREAAASDTASEVSAPQSTASYPSIRDEKRAIREREASTPSVVASRAPTEDELPDVIVSGAYDSTLPEVAGLGADDEVPPAYSEFHDSLSLHQNGFDAGATLGDDGRVNININQTSRQLADLLAPALRRQLNEDTKLGPEPSLPPAYIPPSLGGLPGQKPPPRMNVVIQIVGSRGDVQPFVALGQVLKDTYGHRVRVATHKTFQKFVEDNGLEFFNIGGDPAELMAFMVKNPGLMPGLDALKSGEVSKRRKGIEEIILGCWRSCIEAGDGLGPAPRAHRQGDAQYVDGTSLVIDPESKPFVADAIIANPPSFAHIHVAEKLGIPLHLMFTMPWSPTRAFPQPLANIQSSNTDPVTTNYVSYTLVEMMTWQGLGDIINRFRTKILDLDPLALLWAPGIITRLRIPFTYCWSPALIPKPNDWGNHIDVAGFFFLNLSSSYTPEPELAAFLKDGPPPVYIGFGSIVVDDPDALTRTIFDAIRATGVRALVSKGWGGIGADSAGIPDGVFMLGNCPHDWLFQHVSAVCHHGGAGTTAAGINAGKPTIVVPFFGDQPFWGAMVARAGAGPTPIPHKELTAEKLADAIRICLEPDTQTRAQELGAKIREEQGSDVGGQSFHNHLNFDSMRCAIAPSRVAVWRVRRTKTHLSALAAATLVNGGYLQYQDLKLFRAREYSTEDEPWDPVSACSAALLSDMSSIGFSILDMPRDMFKAAQNKKAKKKEKPEQVDGDDTKSIMTTTNDSESIFSESTSVSAARSVSSTNLGSTVSGDSVDSGSTKQSKSSRRRGKSSPKSGTRTPTTLEEDMEKALEATRSVNNIMITTAKSPMNFCMGLARGFRNAPKLYNDDTVRPVEKVTSLNSGLKLAGKEFGLGMYDGIAGLVTQPIRGMKKDGAAGLWKGFGKGVGGLMLKPAAAIWALPAYSMAGIHAEIRSKFARSAQNYIMASRITQGQEDYKTSSSEEREDIEKRWLTMAGQLKSFYNFKLKEKGKEKAAEGSPDDNNGMAPSYASVSTEILPPTEPPRTGWKNTRNLSFDDRKQLQEQKRLWKNRNSQATGSVASSSSFIDEDTGFNRSDSGENEAEVEEAIQAAIRETSRGDPVEDARIEQAMRSSVRALRRRPVAAPSVTSDASASTGSGPTLSSASTFPVSSESSRGSMAHTASFPLDIKLRPDLMSDDLEDITDEEYQALIEEAVKMSIAEGFNDGHMVQRHDTVTSISEPGDPSMVSPQTEHNSAEQDRALEEAIAASKATEQPPAAGDGARDDNDDEEQLRKAIEESERAHKEELARKTEEDVVMEYVRKQSLAEEEFRRRNTKGKAPVEDDEEDEDLKRALAESMRTTHGKGDDDGAGPSGPVELPG